MGSPNPNVALPYRTVGRYRVYSKLAGGGMATVHLGCLVASAGFSKLVAIKCLREKFASKPEFISMFLDEARVASAINHPNVATALDVVTEEGQLLLVMEYVHGETLAGLLRLSRRARQVAPVPVVVRVLCDALDGLQAAHTASLAGQRLNIVHRDVSPQNIMVGADGNSRVLDFGIAQAAMRSSVTSTGVVKGKTAYMSPEQVQGLGVDARTDVFAAGVVLWEALTGRRLFFSPEPRGAVNLLLSSTILAPSVYSGKVDPKLDGVVLKALQRDPDQRYQSALELAEALRSVAIEGSRAEVASWVTGLAGEVLARRLDLIRAIEVSAARAQPARLRAKRGRSSPPAASGDPTQTQATATTSILPQPPSHAWRARAPWAFAALGLLSAFSASMLATQASSTADGVATSSTDPSARAPTHQLISASAGKATGGSVSVFAASGDLPVVAADSMPLANAVSRKTRAAITKPSPPKTALRAIAAPSLPCSPPYRIDASGIRRVKPECL
jgi:eukaryotic-like serine/threonine-protein kinase